MKKWRNCQAEPGAGPREAPTSLFSRPRSVSLHKGNFLKKKTPESTFEILIQIEAGGNAELSQCGNSSHTPETDDGEQISTTAFRASAPRKRFFEKDTSECL